MQSKAPSTRRVLDRSVRQRRLLVAPVVPDFLGVPTEVEPRAVGDGGAFAGATARPVTLEAARLRPPANEVGGVGGADRVEGRVHVLRVLEHPQVAAGLEQVRADRDGAHAGAQQVGHVEAVGSAGERERQLALELLGRSRRPGSS